jgi:hypothetical protein
VHAGIEVVEIIGAEDLDLALPLSAFDHKADGQLLPADSQQSLAALCDQGANGAQQLGQAMPRRRIFLATAASVLVALNAIYILQRVAKASHGRTSTRGTKNSLGAGFETDVVRPQFLKTTVAQAREGAATEGNRSRASPDPVFLSCALEIEGSQAAIFKLLAKDS